MKWIIKYKSERNKVQDAQNAKRNEINISINISKNVVLYSGYISLSRAPIRLQSVTLLYRERQEIMHLNL